MARKTEASHAPFVHVRWAMAMILVLAPIVEAHGGLPPREIDSMILADDEGLYDYGGCTSGQCAPATEEPGIDLLGLDARHAALPGGAPAWVLHLTYVTEDRAVPGRFINVNFTAAGLARSIRIDDPAVAPKADVDRLVGPTDLGDGHQQGLEVWVGYDDLGVTAGDTVTEIRVASHRADAPDDIMPGIWYSNGVLMPHVPHAADPNDLLGPMTPGVDTMDGPSPLIEVNADLAVFVESGRVLVRNPLAETSQSVSFVAGEGVKVVAQPAQMTLAPGQQQVVNVTATGLSGPTPVSLTFESDIGGRQVLDITVVPPSPAAQSTEEPGAKKDTPTLGLPIALLALAVVLRRAR